MRQLLVILIAAGLIAYDLFMLNGYYFRLVTTEATSLWRTIESFFLSLF